MSNRTREINKITTTIIGISVKLMVYALIILLLYEAVARGYAFGHEIFFAEAVDEAPGQDMVVQIDSKESVSDAAQFLAHKADSLALSLLKVSLPLFSRASSMTTTPSIRAPIPLIRP